MKQIFTLILFLSSAISFGQNEKNIQSSSESKHIVTIHQIYKDSLGRRLYSEEGAYSIRSYKEQNCMRFGEETVTRLSDGFQLQTGQYRDGRRSGIWKYYFENKALQRKETYNYMNSDTTTVTLKEHFTKEGVLVEVYEDFALVSGFLPDGTQVVEDGNGYMKFYSSQTDSLSLEGHFVNGKKHGTFLQYGPGDMITELEYEYGKFVNSNESRSNNDANEDGVYDFSEVMPQYPGGINALRMEVGQNFKIPKALRKSKKDFCGTIITRFTIDEDGNIIRITTLTDYGFGLEQEAIRCIQSVKKKFTPGLQDGKPVKVNFTLPIVVKTK